MTQYEDVISLREFARRLGCGEKTIRDGIAAGKIKQGLTFVNGKPKVKFSIAIVEARNIGLGAKVIGLSADLGIENIPEKLIKREKPDTNSKETKKTDEEEYIGGLGPETTLITANRAERIFKAQLACLEVEYKAGTLVNKAEVFSQLFDFGKEIRSEFESLPGKISPKLATLNNDTSLIAETLANEIRNSLAKLVDKISERKIG